MEKKEYFVAKTFAGLEPLLAKELEALGASNCCILSRSVAFEGPLDLMYEANYRCRTALRVLWRQKTFTFNSNRQYYEELFDFPAERFLHRDGTLAVHATIADTIFKTPLFASVLAKDAICDRFRDLYGERPSVDRESPDVQFHLHIHKNEAQLFLDSSGESLHKRGYKVRSHPAPINEVVAAAMLMLAGYDGSCDFIDPMCGGGTLPIEAAMMALHIPAGFYRRDYGFCRWKGFDPKRWKEIRARAEILDNVDVEFYGSDINPRFVEMARDNVAKAGLRDFIHIERRDMRQSKPARTPALVMMNPPYGERLDVDDIAGFYAEIGDTFKHNYAGCRAFLISSDLQALKRVGLRPSSKHTLFNGPLECRFLGYDLYAGDHKSHVARKNDTER